MSSHNSKKRKRGVVLHQAKDDQIVDTAKPTAVFRAPGIGRKHTLSIALPGSVMSSRPTHELKSVLAGQIARAASVFSVDEIIIFNDGQSQPRHRANPVKGNPRQDIPASSHENDPSFTGVSDPDRFLFHLLTYLEAPPHLRKWLFHMHANLRFAGLLPSLDLPHHLRADEWCEFREGVTYAVPVNEKEEKRKRNRKSNEKKKRSKAKRQKRNHARPTDGSDDEQIDSDDEEEEDEEKDPKTLVEVGFPLPLSLPVDIPPDTRVTLQLSRDPPLGFSFGSFATRKDEDSGVETSDIEATTINPNTPREEQGFYWGYSVRQAASLSSVFTECPYDGGYDVSIGTSERGKALQDVLPSHFGGRMSSSSHANTNGDKDKMDEDGKLPSKYTHLLLVFGGLAGLEAAASADPKLADKGIKAGNVGDLFDAWVDLVPGQGSRTIRTEEAVWVGLGAVRGYVLGCGAGDDEGDVDGEENGGG
ncbi:DUF171-domain-containing protein [Aulographum hederae CBS 113979]|uniref:DUF171-domain-containing protein n=1 Tax=Aulographum hederae CBS 113979 TaxID=1176131 RepID=A0A6G1GSY0_9PEZI|nr:DUF171-domain-containing protein [Aulographum hederae CBS 113979]